MNYYDKQRAKVNIMEGLTAQGWKVFGYKEDESDSMTDYWSPSHWDGIAEKNGYILCVDIFSTSDSGRTSTRKGISQTFPIFHHANPKRNTWHLEKDGEIIASGNGLNSCYDTNEHQEEKRKIVDQAVNKLIKRIESHMQQTKQPTKPETAQAEQNEHNTITDSVTASYTLNAEHNGIEVSFNGKPAQGTINLLKENGFRFHMYKKVWYAKQSEQRLFFVDALCSTLNDIANTEAEQESEAEQTTEQENENPYDFSINHNNKRHDIHFKAWNMEEEQISDFLAAQEIPFYMAANKFICKGLTAEQVTVIEDMNKANGAIIFYDNKETEQPESEAQETITAEAEQPKEQPQSGNKIRVKEITFLWSESALIKNNQTFATFEEAEKLISMAAQSKDSQGYDKTAFLITWEDGETYEGRIDIMRKDMTKKTPLKDHIEHFNYGLIGERKPANYTDEQYESLLKAYGMTEEKQAEIKHFLNTYALEDITEEAPEPTKSDITDTETKPETKAQSNVIDFTQFRNKTTKQAHNSMNKQEEANAETAFKRMILIGMLGKEHYESGIAAFGNVEELFKITALATVSVKEAQEQHK
jgi:hypothetical protein